MPDTQISLKLIYRANIFVVNRARPSLQMGRDDNNDIVVASLFASRLHARVEARDGQFVLTDLSSNGTFVLPDDPSGSEAEAQSDAQSTETRLRQEELVLTGAPLLTASSSLDQLDIRWWWCMMMYPRYLSEPFARYSAEKGVKQ